MRKIIIFLVFLSFFTSSLRAEIVSKILVKGNNRITLETIKVYGDIEIGKNYTESDLNITLNKLYETEFFETIVIDLKNNILSINLKEYPIINQLVIIGEDSNKYKEQIKKVIKLKPKSSFIKSYLAKDN